MVVGGRKEKFSFSSTTHREHIKELLIKRDFNLVRIKEEGGRGREEAGNSSMMRKQTSKVN